MAYLVSITPAPGAFLRRPHLSTVAQSVFLAYDTFLRALSDKATREHLERLTPEKEEADKIYGQLRATSREFRDGILDLFFDDRTELANLSKVYGLF
jgi:hypothetical protein